MQKAVLKFFTFSFIISHFLCQKVQNTIGLKSKYFFLLILPTHFAFPRGPRELNQKKFILILKSVFFFFFFKRSEELILSVFDV